MSNEKVENDRFYESNKTQKILGYMEYAPELFNVIEANSKGLKFTNGKKYPVLERKETHSMNLPLFKTFNDKGLETWVDEKYFIACASDGKLLWEDWNFVNGKAVYNKDKYVPGNHFDADEQIQEMQKKEKEAPIKLIPLFDDYVDEEEIDIRQMAKERNVKPMVIDEEVTIATKTLSGVCEKISPNWELDEKDEGDEKYAKYDSWNCEDPYASQFEYTHIEGKVKDSGTFLVNNLNKCMAAVSKVFGKGDIADPDDLILWAKKYTTALITWQKGFLAVDGAKTRITYDEAQNAFKALQAITNQKVAKKIVGKLLADKIKTLF